MPPRDVLGFPVWLRVALVLVALLFAIAAWSSKDPPEERGFFSTDQDFTGTVGPNDTDVHAFTVVLPGSSSGHGLRFDGSEATATFRPLVPDTPPFHMLLTDHHGMARADIMIDPGSPDTWIHPPPFLALDAGPYTLTLSAMGNQTVDYQLRMSLSFAYRADAEGRVVHPLLIWAPTVAAVLLAVMPAPSWIRQKLSPQEASEIRQREVNQR